MIRRPPRSTRTDTLFPDTSLFRSCCFGLCRNCNRETSDDISGWRITPAREQQADAVRRMDLCSDGTQIRRRRGGAYRERCSGDARSAADLSRVKTSISVGRSEEHTSETPVTHAHIVCRLLLTKKK